MSSNYNGQINLDDHTIGIKNSANIERLEDKLDMAIEKLTERVRELQSDITSFQNSVNGRFDKVDSKFEDLEDKLEARNNITNKKFDEISHQLDKKINSVDDKLPDLIDERIQLAGTRKKALTVDRVISIALAVVTSVCGGIALIAVRALMNL